jgi:hypothetical protein
MATTPARTVGRTFPTSDAAAAMTGDFSYAPDEEKVRDDDDDDDDDVRLIDRTRPRRDAIRVFFYASSEERCNTCIKRRRCCVARCFTRCETSFGGEGADEREDGWIDDAFATDSYLGNRLEKRGVEMDERTPRARLGGCQD